MHIYAEIITIGDEILYGQINDTNSQHIAEVLAANGFKVVRKTSVGDDAAQIREALEEAARRAAVVLTTGGLGPTKDDITKQVFADFFATPLVFDQQVEAHIARLFESRGRTFTELNRQQAMVPAAAQVLDNPIGTAPGMWFDTEQGCMASMPGVPHEMRRMLAEQVVPRLRARFQTPFIIHRMLRTIGIPESVLSHMLEEWEGSLPSHIKLAYLPKMGQVRLRLTASGLDKEELESQLQELVDRLRPILGDKLYAEQDEEIEGLLGGLLREKGLRIATAESCTGGLLASRITAIPGCSDYYTGGIVAYSNQVKAERLEVDAELLLKYGAVSEEVAAQMAQRARTLYKADIGVATTGIAGPSGGTARKPVGTIWIAYADAHGVQTKLLQLSSTDRVLNVQATVNAVFRLLWENIV